MVFDFNSLQHFANSYSRIRAYHPSNNLIIQACTVFNSKANFNLSCISYCFFLLEPSLMNIMCPII